MLQLVVHSEMSLTKFNKERVNDSQIGLLTDLCVSADETLQYYGETEQKHKKKKKTAMISSTEYVLSCLEADVDFYVFIKSSGQNKYGN